MVMAAMKEEIEQPASDLRVPEGYKQTEVGVIPEDWSVAPLESFTSFISYGFTNPMPTTLSGVYMITAKDINSGKIQFETARRTTVEAYQSLLTSKSKPKRNDLLLTKDGTLGRLALVDDTVVCINQSVAILRPNSGVVPSFFKLLLEAPQYQARMLDDAGGSTIKHIYITIVNRMPLGVPATKTEQEAIAGALSDVDALIAAIERLITKKRRIKQGAMQDLLRPKDGWVEKKLGDFLNYEQPTKYLVSNTDYEANGQIPVLTAGKTFILGYTNDKHGVFRHPLPAIIFDDFTTASKYVNFPFKAKSSAMKMLVPKSSAVNMRFIFELMQRINFPLGDHKRHWIGEYQHIILNVPEPKEQTAIATILSDMDAEITVLTQKLVKTRQLKQGMMAELLTGRIRLV